MLDGELSFGEQTFGGTSIGGGNEHADFAAMLAAVDADERRQAAAARAGGFDGKRATEELTGAQVSVCLSSPATGRVPPQTQWRRRRRHNRGAADTIAASPQA